MGDASTDRILLLWSEARSRRAVYKILRATGCEVEFADSSPSPEIVESYRLIIVDSDSSPSECERFLSDLGASGVQTPILVMTANRDKASLIGLLSHQVFTNLIAKNDDLSAVELVVTVQKILRNDHFGLEKYLTWGVQAHKAIVNSSADKTSTLDEIERYLHNIGCNRRLVGLARGVGDELLMNAIYNAPVDADGNFKYARRSRDIPVDLLEGEEVLLRYACDGRYFAISVQDNFGRLDRRTVVGYLRKCFMKGDDQVDDKAGGAGLGLYYIFESISHLVINISPTKRTEMVGLIDVSGSYRDFAAKTKSFNIFIED